MVKDLKESVMTSNSMNRQLKKKLEDLGKRTTDLEEENLELMN